LIGWVFNKIIFKSVFSKILDLSAKSFFSCIQCLFFHKDLRMNYENEMITWLSRQKFFEDFPTLISADAIPFSLIVWKHPGIPDLQACIMKYRSGNAQALMRGAFEFEFPDRISPSFSLRYAEKLLCPIRSGLTSSEFPYHARNPRPNSFDKRYIESFDRALKKREIHRLRSQHLRAYKTIGRKVEAILERCNVHKFILNRKKIIILI